MEITEEGLAGFFKVVLPLLDERQRRLVAAALVPSLGRGGQARVAEAADMSRNTLIVGARELAGGAGRHRRVCVGRERAARRRWSSIRRCWWCSTRSSSRGSRGDPMSPLRWTIKSTHQLARELGRLGHQAGASLVGRTLHYLGYSLQANAKVTEGAQHPDRDGQFRYINDTASEHLAAGQPVIRVDCKKKELVGDYANGGTEWEPEAAPTRVGTHDFPDPDMPKAIPYGVYAHRRQRGLGQRRRRPRHPGVRGCLDRPLVGTNGPSPLPRLRTRLMITADAGGSNAYRSRAFKVELARLAATIGLAITVCHMPPGTSKWNKVEHRLFSFISMNWRGKPLTTYRIIIELIAATTTTTGRSSVQADLDTGYYPTGQKITDKQLAALPIRRHDLAPRLELHTPPTITPN